MNWVTKHRLAELTGLTAGAIDRRRERGLWLKDIHWRKAKDGRIWYSVRDIDKWIEAA